MPMQGRIIEVYRDGPNRVGLVEFDGKRRAIYLSLIPEVEAGDEVLFHAGFATERIGRKEGQTTSEQAAGVPLRTRKTSLETNSAYRLLSELDPQQLRKLIPLAEDREYGAGQIIFPAGVTSSFLHLIVSGDVVLEAVTGEYADEVQRLHGGDAMGWSAITGEGLTHFQSRALTPVTTIAFHGTELRKACEADPALGYALMKRLVELASERLDVMRMKLAEKSHTLTAR